MTSAASSRWDLARAWLCATRPAGSDNDIAEKISPHCGGRTGRAVEMHDKQNSRDEPNSRDETTPLCTDEFAFASSAQALTAEVDETVLCLLGAACASCLHSRAAAELRDLASRRPGLPANNAEEDLSFRQWRVH